MHWVHEKTRGGGIVSSVARFSGRLDKQLLHDSLCILQRRHGALRCVIRDLGRKSNFVELTDPPPIPLCWRDCNSLDEWPQTVLDFGREPFDVRHGPLARMHVIHQQGNDITDVCLAIHHAISDGRSILALYHELACLCSGEGLAPAFYPGLRPVPQIPRERGIIKPILGEIRARIGLRPLLREFPLTDLQQTALPLETLRRRIWTPEATEKLRHKSRLEGTTLYGALASAVALSLHARHALSKRSVEIRSPMDIRKLCDPPLIDDPLGCYSTVIGFIIPDIDRLSFWDLGRTMRAGVQRQIDTGLWAAGWRLLGGMLRLGIMPQVQPVFCNINNLGYVRDTGTAKLRLQEFSLTVNQQHLSISFMVIAVTIGGALNLTLRSPWHSPQEVDELFDDIFHRLEEACSGGPQL